MKNKKPKIWDKCLTTVFKLSRKASDKDGNETS